MYEDVPNQPEEIEAGWLKLFDSFHCDEEEQKEKVIIEVKSIFAKLFVFGDLFGHHWDSDIFSVDLSRGPENIDLSVRLESNVFEKKELPEDIKSLCLIIQIRGGRLEKSPIRPNFYTHFRFVFEDATFIVGEKSITLNEIYPEIKVEITDEVVGESYDPDTNIIQLHHLSDLKDVFMFLHEAGHAIDNKKRGVEDWKKDMAKNLGLGERNAWAEALKIARKIGIPITDFFLKYDLQKSLKSYDYVAKEPISDESRKKKRKQSLEENRK